MNVTRSIVYGVVGPCKTESSQKPVPVHPTVLEALSEWRGVCLYNKLGDWVFASKRHHGQKPIWGQAILRKYIRPVAQRVGIQKRFGWHTFRHYVLHIASGRGSGSESNAGTAATLHDPCDLGYLHPGGDSRQAYSPHRGSLVDCWKWRIEAGLGHEGDRSTP